MASTMSAQADLSQAPVQQPQETTLTPARYVIELFVLAAAALVLDVAVCGIAALF